MFDLLVIGGGVIGLSLAYEALRLGMSVRVLDRGLPGQESSWAGAGILTAALPHPANSPAEQLTAWSHSLHEPLASALFEETGVATGFRRCGGLYIADGDRLHGEENRHGELASAAFAWRRQGLSFREASAGEVAAWEPALAGSSLIGRAVEVPGDGQLRNPRHVKALLAACLRRGATITPGLAADDFVLAPDRSRIHGVATAEGLLTAGAYCLTSGCWSAPLAKRVGLEIAVRPLRGQIALLQCNRALLKRVINVGPRYLVPRDDGRVLVGSTEDEVGFDKRTTAVGIAGLLDFALRLAPGLAGAALERTWAGLRPATADGLPYLGRLGELQNAFVAAGHFRNGLCWSPATARLICQLVREEAPTIDPTPFRVGR